VPGAALAVGAVDGDVQAGVAHDRVAVGKAAGIAQLGQDGRGDQHPDPIVAVDQGAAARLAAGEGTQPALQRIQFQVELVELPQRGRHLQAAGLRQRDLLQPAASRPRQQSVVRAGQPVVEQHRVQPLLEGGALIHQRLA
jgi:hypothetical protein